MTCTNLESLALISAYRFDITWLKDIYRDRTKIQSMVHLPEKTRKYLKIIHDLHRSPNQLAEKPSRKDLLSLQQAYGEESINIVPYLL